MNARNRLVSDTVVTSASNALRRRRRRLGTPEAIQGGTHALNKENPMMEAVGRATLANEFRGGKYLHVSDLIYKCLRMIALHRTTKLPITAEPLSHFQGLTFSVGNAIHDFVRARVRESSPDTIYGHWLCRCHKTMRTGTFAQVTGLRCDTCGSALLEYGELSVQNDEFMLTGSIDLILLIDGVFLLSEIKSIKHESWEQLSQPLPEHILQIAIYWELARRAGWAIYDEVSVLYVSKGFQFSGSPYKEFHVDPQQHIHRVEPLLEDAKELAECESVETLPENIECPQRTSPKAKKCCMVTPCFEFA